MRRVLVLLVLAACGGSDEPCGEPRYTGAATDEAWRALVDARSMVMTGGAQAPRFTAPAEGKPIAAPPRITWESPLKSKVLPHLPPVTGDAYLVEITVPGEACPVALMTTELEWQLDASEWAAIDKAAPGTVSVGILGAYLNENRVMEGPFSPAAPLILQLQ